MRRILTKVYNIFSYLFFDPIDKIRLYRAIPLFLKNLALFSRMNKETNIPLRLIDLYVTTSDRFRSAGTASGHYFFQDIWAATKVYNKKVQNHIDIGSRIDGFIAHILPFCQVQYVDIRPVTSQVTNLTFITGSILELPFPDNSIQSLSCLHVIEHIGLGRYGDPIDPFAHQKSAQELSRVLAPGGTLLLGTPVGEERICYDAHRVFNPQTVRSMFQNLELLEFSLIDDKGDRIIENTELTTGATCRYGCGLFEFTKV